ncbi:MAG: leucine-rich repeat domain-containing protein [Lachnospiraceae bacterium]|nr:leucine-rich repeat domain-containing protein [Lachnospiraceae bacterium]
MEVAGINKFDSIILTQGSGLEMWGRMSGEYHYDDMISSQSESNDIEANYGQIVLSSGIHGSESDNPANGISFRDSLIVKIGDVANSATTAFENIRTVNFGNYDFHDRKANNGYIYAHTAFKNVENVNVTSAKIKVVTGLSEGDKIFDKGSMGRDVICTTFQEGQIDLTGNLGDVELKNKYYSSYPQGKVDRMDDAGDAGSPYVKTTSVSTESTADRSSEESYKITVNTEQKNYVLTSTDPILYSVAYVIDDGTGFDNPDKGSMTMDGFEKGYYIEDPKDGHFEAWIAAGETVNVTILPGAGYQYIKNTLNINGVTIDTTASDDNDAVGKYSFIMPANAGHMCAGFIEAGNVVNADTSGTGLSGAEFTVTDGVIDQGNAKLEIDAANVSDNDKTNIESQVTDASEITYAYMDVTLSESVVKNYDKEKSPNEQESWDKQLTDLGNDKATITVTLDSDLQGYDAYDVVRLHNGVAEKLSDVSVTSGGKVTFATDKFSTYAIAAKRFGGSSQPEGLDYSTPSSGTVKLDGTTVTIENAVISGDGFSELCLYGKEYGKTPMTLVVKGTNTVDTLIFDTAVTVICEEGASLTFNASKSDLEADNTEYTGTKGSYTLGANTVLEGNVFKYKVSASGGSKEPTEAESALDAAKKPAQAEVGTTITDTSTGSTSTTSTYTVTEKSAGTGDAGEAAYTGESEGSKATSVTIPDTVTGADGTVYEVTKIEDKALLGNKTVKEITVGDNIEEIGAGAFQNATNLTTVKLGKKVAKIDKNSFAGCTKLKKITASGSAITTIGEAAFKGDKALTSIDFSKSKVKTIGKNAFNGDKKLKTIKLNGNAITKVGKGAFKNIKKKATITVYAKNKKIYNKAVKLIKKSGVKNVKFKKA